MKLFEKRISYILYFLFLLIEFDNGANFGGGGASYSQPPPSTAYPSSYGGASGGYNSGQGSGGWNQGRGSGGGGYGGSQGKKCKFLDN